MNLPNKITLLRVALVPVFLIVYLAQSLAPLFCAWLAFVVFVMAAITDAVDGHLARKMGLVTNFGKLLDPLADKLLACSALVAFVHTGAVPVWTVIIIICREFYVSGLRQLSLEQGVVLAAATSGKVKMVVQMVMIIYILLPPPFTILVFPAVQLALAVIAAAVSVYSAVDYTRRNFGLFR